MKTLLTLFVLFFSSAGVTEVTLHPKDFLNGFPICSFESSLGQICKENPSLLFSDYKNDSTIEIKDEKLLIETDNWYYSFEIINRKKNEVIVEFVDDGKIGTYLSVSHYKINFDKDSNEWKITAKKIISPEEEKTGKFREFKESITFNNVDLLEEGEVNKESLISELDNKDTAKNTASKENDSNSFVINFSKIIKIILIESTSFWLFVCIVTTLSIVSISFKFSFKEFINRRYSRLLIYFFLLSLFIFSANTSESYLMTYTLSAIAAFIHDPGLIFIGIIIGSIFYKHVILLPALILIGFIAVNIISSLTVIDSYNTPLLNLIRTVVIFYTGYLISSVRQLIFNK